jgi:hypothetical protein
LTTALPSQVGRVWSFEELVAESDLVIIGQVLDVQDTGRKGNHPELRPETPAVELATEIRVLATLKPVTGATTDKIRSLVLRHYRIDLDEWRRQHPASPEQPPAGLVNSGQPLTVAPGGETYLFFLKRVGLGWESTTGQTFPNQSVFPLGGASRIVG